MIGKLHALTGCKEVHVPLLAGLLSAGLAFAVPGSGLTRNALPVCRLSSASSGDALCLAACIAIKSGPTRISSRLCVHARSHKQQGQSSSALAEGSCAPFTHLL